MGRRDGQMQRLEKAGEYNQYRMLIVDCQFERFHFTCIRCRIPHAEEIHRSGIAAVTTEDVYEEAIRHVPVPAVVDLVIAYTHHRVFKRWDKLLCDISREEKLMSDLSIQQCQERRRFLRQQERFRSMMSINGVEATYHTGTYGSGVCPFDEYDWEHCLYPQRIVLDMRWFDTNDHKCSCGLAQCECVNTCPRAKMDLVCGVLKIPSCVYTTFEQCHRDSQYWARASDFEGYDFEGNALEYQFLYIMEQQTYYSDDCWKFHRPYRCDEYKFHESFYGDQPGEESYYDPTDYTHRAVAKLEEPCGECSVCVRML